MHSLTKRVEPAKTFVQLGEIQQKEKGKITRKSRNKSSCFLVHYCCSPIFLSNFRPARTLYYAHQNTIHSSLSTEKPPGRVHSSLTLMSFVLIFYQFFLGRVQLPPLLSSRVHSSLSSLCTRAIFHCVANAHSLSRSFSPITKI